MIRRSRIADDQRGRVLLPASGVRTEPLDDQTMVERALYRIRLVLMIRQRDQRVQARRDTGDADVRRLAAQSGDQVIPSPPIDKPHVAHLPIQRSGGDEFGESELFN